MALLGGLRFLLHPIRILGERMSVVPFNSDYLSWVLHKTQLWVVLYFGHSFKMPSIIFLVFFWPCHVACGILFPRPGIEPVPPAVEAQSLNHWTTREVPKMPSTCTPLSPLPSLGQRMAHPSNSGRMAAMSMCSELQVRWRWEMYFVLLTEGGLAAQAVN